MLLDKYDFEANDTFDSFSFESQGKNGTIKKRIDYRAFSRLPNGDPVYNLGFGDWTEETELLDDTSISNNGDRDKVLATVAYTLISFNEKNGNIPVYARGVTPAKNRLYQMGINANLKEIKTMFDVYGSKDNQWVEFEPGCNYEAFLVIKK
ncbi:hypothetical protein HHL16_20220 [Pseudoflavitalea sp. G-6-1-2]|uniref:DUF6934 family protein n=1 Tax=Pseudoflavitalea sp. G-6-1-2 TaxID=2728841 RepID=UPI00146A2AF4|nr:hypothetical protein [Pseudoflavitalea sp. G-6-1-2]NML23215.1 hypothetical protein [Pseudoflavitalea sp. G-6-1-2]